MINSNVFNHLVKWTRCIPLKEWHIQRHGHSIKNILSVPIKTHMSAELASRLTMWNSQSQWLVSGGFWKSSKWERVCFLDAGKWVMTLYICKTLWYFPLGSGGMSSDGAKTKSVYWFRLANCNRLWLPLQLFLHIINEKFISFNKYKTGYLGCKYSRRIAGKHLDIMRSKRLRPKWNLMMKTGQWRKRRRLKTGRRSKCCQMIQLEVQDTHNQLVGLELE